MFPKVIAFLELSRLKNCLIAGVATIIGFLLSEKIISFNLLLIFFSTIFVCSGGQAINDVFDFNVDKKINKKKPLPSDRLTIREAVLFSFLCFFIGLVFAFLVNMVSFIIAIIFVLLLILYSSVFYKKKYFGNIIVALGTAITFVFGASATGKIPAIIFFFFLTAFFANMSRELTKDFEDLKKDRGFKKTLPMLSKRLAKNFIIFYYCASILTAIITGIIFSLNIFYFVLVFFSTIIFLKSILLLTKNNFKTSQNFSKKGMIVSLIAFITAILR